MPVYIINKFLHSALTDFQVILYYISQLYYTYCQMSSDKSGMGNMRIFD